MFDGEDIIGIFAILVLWFLTLIFIWGINDSYFLKATEGLKPMVGAICRSSDTFLASDRTAWVCVNNKWREAK